MVGLSRNSQMMVFRDVICNNSCKTCFDGTTNGCLSCYGSNYLRSDHSCQTACASNEIITASYVCSQCDTNCATCSTTVTNCTACEPGFIMNGTSCVASCPIGKYHKVSTNTCDACHTDCASCSGVTNNQCLTCSGLLYLEGTTCIASCPTGKFENTSTNTCDACHGDCAECTGAADS